MEIAIQRILLGVIFMVSIWLAMFIIRVIKIQSYRQSIAWFIGSKFGICICVLELILYIANMICYINEPNIGNISMATLMIARFSDNLSKLWLFEGEDKIYVSGKFLKKSNLSISKYNKDRKSSVVVLVSGACSISMILSTRGREILYKIVENKDAFNEESVQ